MDNSSQEIVCFRCDCGKVVEKKMESKEYFTIYGNLLVGESGGILGSKLPEKIEDLKPYRICVGCMRKLIYNAVGPKKK